MMCSHDKHEEYSLPILLLLLLFLLELLNQKSRLFWGQIVWKHYE